MSTLCCMLRINGALLLFHWMQSLKQALLQRHVTQQALNLTGLSIRDSSLDVILNLNPKQWLASFGDENAPTVKPYISISGRLCIYIYRF